MLSGAVCCVFLLALAVGNDPVRASGATRGLPTDDKVAIVLKPSALVFGSCPKLPAPTMNVRLHTLKTKSGAIFRRKVVTDDEFACLASLGSQPLTAGSIQQCSEQTEAAGYKMFRWDGGQCSGYTKGFPQNFARCAGAGSVVLYFVDVKEITESLVVSNITLAFSGDLSILLEAAWDVTPNSCFVMYRVTFNNNDNFVSDKLETFSLGTPYPCAEYPLTVTPVDANHAVLGPAVTVKVVIPKALELSLNLTHGVTAVKASWRTEYTCNPNKQPLRGGPLKTYTVGLGQQTGTTNYSTFEFLFDKGNDYCSDTASTLPSYINEVTLTALDGTGAQLGTATATLTNTSMPGHRYLSYFGYCFYYQKLEETPGGVGLAYDQLLDFCLGTMHSDINTGKESLDDYIFDLGNFGQPVPNVVMGPHYLGVTRNSTSGKWMWLSGSELSASDNCWDSGEPSTAGDCVQLNANMKMAAVSCAATNLATVCVEKPA